MGHSRPQIAREFHLNERTLSWLEQSGRIQLDWKPVNGLLTCELTDEHRKLLACAACALPAQEGATPDTMLWPFHRFLILRTLQLPADIQYQELIDRNIVAAPGFTEKRLEAIRERIIGKLPLIIQRFVRAGKAPETEEEKSWFNCLLDVCEIHLTYYHPELEQSFAFMTDREMKECIDCAISTKSPFVDVQKFLMEVVGLRISVEGLAYYQQMFHDMNLVSNDNIKLYLKCIRPSLRSKLGLAMSSTIDTYRIKSGIDDKMEMDRVLPVLKDELINDLLRTLNDKTTDARKDFGYTLRSLMTVIERMDRGKPTKGASPKNARIIQVAPQKVDQMKIIQLPSPKSDAQSQ